MLPCPCFLFHLYSSFCCWYISSLLHIWPLKNKYFMKNSNNEGKNVHLSKCKICFLNLYLISWKVLSFTNNFNTFSGMSPQFSCISMKRSVRLWIDLPVTRSVLWYRLNPLSHFWIQSSIWFVPATNHPLQTACVQESGFGDKVSFWS